MTKGLPPATRWPLLDASDRAAVSRVLDRGVLSGAAAPEMRGLEAEFAATLGVRYCLATNSGTSALHLALGATGVGPGHEVVIPALSFVATAQAVVHQGATPVFAEVDPATYTMRPEDVAARITPRTRAIVPVHLHGLPVDMDAIGAVAARAGVILIEDAAQAHGALYRGRPVGTLGAAAAFSLNSTKNLPAGEGGLFVTDDEDLYARAVRMRFNGLDLPSKWDATHPLDDEAEGLAAATGFMYLPGELTCAIARSQLERLEATTRRSQRNAARLSERLAALPGVQPPVVPADRTHVFHKYRVRFDPRGAGLDVPAAVLRDHVLLALRAEGVEAVRWQTAPLPAHPRFAGAERYAHTEAVLAGSLIVGSQSYPLFAQPVDVVDAWADAFERIWRTLPF